MQKIVILLTLLAFSGSSLGHGKSIDLKQFAQQYFSLMTATQAPNATAQDLEAYLALLTDDIGHSHLPHVTDDSRLPDGKQAMRKGMTYYLASHTEYNATLLDVFVFNHSAIAIRYKNYAKGIHPQSKQAIEYSQVMMEVLEMENGKVAVIRKYHE
jgi:ketosteroid isomerase-like protein